MVLSPACVLQIIRYQFRARLFQFGFLSSAFQSALSDIEMAPSRRDIDSFDHLGWGSFSSSGMPDQAWLATVSLDSFALFTLADGIHVKSIQLV
jgi:hypothetical protein